MLTFTDLIDCFINKVQQKSVEFLIDYELYFAENRKVFGTIFTNFSVQEIWEGGQRAVDEMCCALYTLHKNLSESTIDPCEKDGLSFSNKEAIISKITEEFIIKLNCNENCLSEDSDTIYI